MNTLLFDVLTICVEAVGAVGGTFYLHDPKNKILTFAQVLPEEVRARLPFTSIPDTHGVAGEVFHSQQIKFSHFDPKQGTETDIEKKTGIRRESMITVPIMMEGVDPIGVVQLINKKEGVFDENDATVLDTVSAVSMLAILNSRLLEEQTRASQLLGMGKLAHDIKNLAFALEANLSGIDFTLKPMEEEIRRLGVETQMRMYLDGITNTFDELMRSIDRVKRYSILISDLSAGKPLHPVKKLAPLAETIELAAAYLESEGRKSHIALVYAIQRDAPPFLHDEMFVFRIVQNLVSNAIKASRERTITERDALRGEGEDAIYDEIVVSYKYHDCRHILEVVDHGPGMTKDTIEQILSGTARSFWGNNTGSGWGTKIVLELTATHEGIVEIDSEIGVGSTFRVIFPHNEAES